MGIIAQGESVCQAAAMNLRPSERFQTASSMVGLMLLFQNAKHVVQTHTIRIHAPVKTQTRNSCK